MSENSFEIKSQLFLKWKSHQIDHVIEQILFYKHYLMPIWQICPILPTEIDSMWQTSNIIKILIMWKYIIILYYLSYIFWPGDIRFLTMRNHEKITIDCFDWTLSRWNVFESVYVKHTPKKRVFFQGWTDFWIWSILQTIIVDRQWAVLE